MESVPGIQQVQNAYEVHETTSSLQSPAGIQKNSEQTEPNETLYIRNLVETRAIKALKEALMMIFSQYGNVLDIRIKRNISLRGQAFVIYDTKDSAVNAMKEIQGFPLFSKPMEIQYAHDKSYIITEMQGGQEAREAQKRKRKEEKEILSKEAKKIKTEMGQKLAQPKPIAVPDELLPPNNILFIQDLPSEATEAQINDAFSQFPGFKEVRLVPGKSSIAFVEYDDEMQSAIAKQSLDKYNIIPGHPIRVTFAKK